MDIRYVVLLNVSEHEYFALLSWLLRILLIWLKYRGPFCWYVLLTFQLIWLYWEYVVVDSWIQYGLRQIIVKYLMVKLIVLIIFFYRCNLTGIPLIFLLIQCYLNYTGDYA